MIYTLNDDVHMCTLAVQFSRISKLEMVIACCLNPQEHQEVSHNSPTLIYTIVSFFTISPRI